MADPEASWLDEAFAEEPKEQPAASSSQEFDWIDDAFDERKEDPLARKGMTGCSGKAVLLAGVALIAVIAFAFLSLLALGGVASSL